MLGGGPGTADPLTDFDLPAARADLAGTGEILDESTADLMRMARLVPGNDLSALLRMVEAVKEEPFIPAEAVPGMPLLLVSGDRDPFAEGSSELAALSGTAEVLLLPARTHANAVTSRVFKTAAIDFLV